jgi:hypothetical protein
MFAAHANNGAGAGVGVGAEHRARAESAAVKKEFAEYEQRQAGGFGSGDGGGGLGGRANAQPVSSIERHRAPSTYDGFSACGNSSRGGRPHSVYAGFEGEEEV